MAKKTSREALVISRLQDKEDENIKYFSKTFWYIKKKHYLCTRKFSYEFRI